MGPGLADEIFLEPLACVVGRGLWRGKAKTGSEADLDRKANPREEGGLMSFRILTSSSGCRWVAGGRGRR